jgi:hypothetical protein
MSPDSDFSAFISRPARFTHINLAIYDALQSAVLGRRGTLSRRGFVAFGQKWRGV